MATSDPASPAIDPAPRSTSRLVFGVLGVWSVIVIVVLTVAALTIGTASVAGASMFPTLRDGQTLIVSKVSTPEVGDIVTADIRLDTGAERSVVKRVIGTGGDVVAYDGCRLTRNGRMIPEPYVDVASIVGDCGSGFEPIVEPDGHVWLMGDNRAHSSDSRAYGTVPLTAVDGVLWFSL